MLNNSRANTKAKTKVAYKVSTSSSAISIQRDKVHISQKNEKMIKLVVKLKIKRKGIHSEGERKKIETNGTDDNKDFRKWWHREGSKQYGINIDKETIEYIWREWNELGRTKVK